MIRLSLCRQAMRECQLTGYDTLLIDTAGRLHVDEELMTELQQIKQETTPVRDSLYRRRDDRAGRGALRQQFHERVGLTGVILTKMEGDTRGGAALSIKEVTGQPIKFIGVGRALRRDRALLPGSDRPAHSGDGRRALADREGSVRG